MGENRRPTLRREEGFSLVELLVAMAIFGVVLMAMAGMLISSARSIGDQRLRTAATRVATDHLEWLRSLPFADLDDQAGVKEPPTKAHGSEFTINTEVTPIDALTGEDAVTGLPAGGGRVKQITAKVSWKSYGTDREAFYSTAIAPDDPGTAATAQRIGTITMFPSPATVDALGRSTQPIEVTVPLEGFPSSTLVDLRWTNADGTAGAKTLTSTTGLNWRETLGIGQLLATIGADGRGEMRFDVSAGSLVAVYTLAVQGAAASPPAITATIDRNPITVAKPVGTKTCAAVNQCQNTNEVTFTVTSTGLDPAQDSVVLQYQLHDGTFQEVPLTPGVSGQWVLALRQKTTKLLVGTNRAFRFTAIRSADGATASATVLRDVVRT